MTTLTYRKLLMHLAVAGLCACGSVAAPGADNTNANGSDVGNGNAAAGNGNHAAGAADGDASDANQGAGGDVAPGSDGNGTATVGQRYDVVGIVGTGQSLSVGYSGNFCSLDDESEFTHYKLADTSASFALANPNAASLYLLPLNEPVRPLYSGGADVYPNNLSGVTPHTGMAHQLSLLSYAHRGVDYPTAHTVVGESGRSITAIRPGGVESDGSAAPSYAAALYEVQALRRLLAAQGKTYAVGGALLTHGEADWLRQTYGDDVHALQQALQANVRLLTGQQDGVPLFVSQQSTLSPGSNAGNALASASFSWSRYGVWRAALDYPDDIVLLGPKYQNGYAGDNLHMVQAGYHSLGEKHAQVYYQVVERQEPFLPTLPLFVSRQDATHLRLPYHVPVPPLTWDNEIAPLTAGGTQHPSGSTWGAWANGRGFEVLDGNGTPLTIASAALDGNGTEVVLTMASALPASVVVQYAMTQDASSGTVAGGTASGAFGTLRDSDPFAPRSRNSVFCTLTQNSSVVTFQTSLWSGNIAGRIEDPQGNLLATLLNPSDTLWKTWNLQAPYTGPTRTLACTVTDRFANYGVGFSLVSLWTQLAATAIKPTTNLYAAANVGGAAAGACLAQQDGRYVAGTYVPSCACCRLADAQASSMATAFHLLVQPTGKTLTWKAATAGATVPDAVVAGTGADGRPTYVCRAARGSDTLVGTLSLASSGQGGCSTVDAGGIRQLEASYEVLVGSRPML